MVRPTAKFGFNTPQAFKAEDAAYYTAAAAAVGLALAAFFLAGWPPMVDLPQHISQAGYLNHLYFKQSGVVDLSLLCPAGFRPYHLFHWLAAFLLWLLPIGTAVPVAVSFLLIAYALALRFFLGAFKVNRWLFIPGLLWFFGQTYAWGLAPNLLAFPFFLLVMGLTRYCLENRPRAELLLALALVAAALVHPIPFLMAAYGSGLYMVLVLWPKPRRLAARLWPNVLIVSSAALYYGLMAVEKSGADLFRPETPSFFEKLALVPRYAASLFHPAAIEITLTTGVLLALAALAVLQVKERWQKLDFRRLLWLALLLFVPYFVLPEYLLTMYNFFGRFLPFPLMFLAVLAADPTTRFSRAACAVAVSCAALFLVVNAVNHYQWGRTVTGLEKVIRSVEDGKRSLGVAYRAPGEPTRLDCINHLHAYVQAEHGGVFSYAFTHHHKMPLRDCDPRRQYLSAGLDFHPEDFDFDRHLPLTDYIILRWPYPPRAKNPFDRLVEDGRSELVLEEGTWRVYRVRER